MYARAFSGFNTAIGNLSAALAISPGGSPLADNLITSSGTSNSVWRANYLSTDIRGLSAANVVFLTEQAWPTSLPGTPA